MRFFPLPPKIDLRKPVMTFYQEGDWLRIECQAQPTRYIRKDVAVMLLHEYGKHAVPEEGMLYLKGVYER